MVTGEVAPPSGLDGLGLAAVVGHVDEVDAALHCLWAPWAGMLAPIRISLYQFC